MTDTGNARILDPRVNLIADSIHRLIEKHIATRLNHERIHDLAITVLETLNGNGCLREPFSVYVDPKFVPGNLVTRVRDDSMFRGMVTEVRNDRVSVLFEDGHRGDFGSDGHPLEDLSLFDGEWVSSLGDEY
jgi:hypothetical protein